MKKIIAILILLLLSFGILTPITEAAEKHESWNHVVDDMEAVLENAYQIYESGDKVKAKAEVDVAYYSYYEKLGFEKTVMSYISGNRASVVEYQFSTIKKKIASGEKNAVIRQEIDQLITYLREDANQLDGVEKSPWTSFFSSLIIILREGFEAILIVGAIIAYLIKMKQQDKLKIIYLGIVAAGIASIIMAFALMKLTSLSGANQELIEGFTMLVAVIVLFQVSNWMISKSESDAMQRYVEGKIDASIAQGGVFSLAFAVFLAVFREGAETIIFYQALLADDSQYRNMIWLGLAVGTVGLVFIYLAIRFLSIKIPMKPFFRGTSILLFIMAFTFLGNGIKELQEGNLIGVTTIDGFSAISLLGIYPTLETLVPQIIILILTIALIWYQIKGKKAQAN
ncbi:MAG: FTR1 family iron permease [Streptococcaceae bacterium]|jgi:high-affinity iron transporter|nr:FTR1 family iron permease [Streptococcaceae bacterium]MCH4178210.1 FTR1 family iron permease [Streptococcaceae bacterium]